MEKKTHPHTRYHTILFLAVHTVKANETYSRGVRSNYKVYIKALKLCINCTTDVPFTVLQAKVYSRFVHFFLSFFLYTCTANLKRVTIMQMHTRGRQDRPWELYDACSERGDQTIKPQRQKGTKRNKKKNYIC